MPHRPARIGFGRERRSSLTTQIDQLVSLQDLDQRLRQKELQLEALRQRTAAIASDKEIREREVQERQVRIDELERQRRDLDGQLKVEEEKIKEKRVRLNRVRNESELLATQREIELLKEANGELEEGVLTLMEQLDEERGQQAEIQTHIDELDARLAEETAQTAKEIATLEEESRAGSRQRESLAADMDPTLCTRYGRIFRMRRALAVVEVRNGTCQGCHMRIPPHLCNQIQSSQLQGRNDVHYCPHPHCGRIVYVRLDAE